MRIRAFAAALLIWGATASIACEAYCAHAFGGPEQPVAEAPAPCHGHAASGHGPAAPERDDSEASSCCPGLAYAAATPDPVPDAAPGGPATVSTVVCRAIGPEEGRLAVRHPPDLAEAPWVRENPPLLT